MWTMHGGSTGEGEASADREVERWRRRHEQPENEVPVPVPVSCVLGRTEDVAVLLTQLHAHRNGFWFTIGVRLRTTPADHHDMDRQVFGFSPVEGALLVGLEFADGRRVATAAGQHAWPPAPVPPGGEDAVVLWRGGGSGGGRSHDHSWWVSPLPPAGPVRLVVRWDAQGVPETVTEVDGALIAAAGSGAEELWPWQQDRPAATERRPPALPSDGWFAQR